MKVVSTSILWVMKALKAIGMISLGLVMLIVSVGVISRLLGKPLLGVIEMSEIVHFVVVVFAFAYTQSEKEHISIDIFVNRFSSKVQSIFDWISQILTIAVTMLISYIFFTLSMNTSQTTLLLDFPYTILKVILGIGFLVWGLVAICQISFKTYQSENKKLESEKDNLQGESQPYPSEKEVKLDV